MKTLFKNKHGIFSYCQRTRPSTHGGLRGKERWRARCSAILDELGFSWQPNSVIKWRETTPLTLASKICCEITKLNKLPLTKVPWIQQSSVYRRKHFINGARLRLRRGSVKLVPSHRNNRDDHYCIPREDSYFLTFLLINAQFGLFCVQVDMKE